MASQKKKLKITGVTHVFAIDKKGDIIVDHPGIKKGAWKKANLTKVAGVKSVKQGVISAKSWHKDNPHKKTKKK